MNSGVCAIKDQLMSCLLVMQQAVSAANMTFVGMSVWGLGVGGVRY